MTLSMKVLGCLWTSHTDLYSENYLMRPYTGM